METYDTEGLIVIQVAQLEKEKKELNEKLRIIAKRVDHIERAYRKEERPLLARDYEQQQKNDRETFEALQRARKEAARVAHQEDMATKARLSRMLGDYESRREAIFAKKAADFAKRKEVAHKKIEEEKAKRRNAVLKAREEERLRLEAEQQREREKAEAARRKEEGELVENCSFSSSNEFFNNRAPCGRTTTPRGGAGSCRRS
jgi:translation initiation factor 3 subunit A